MTGEVPPAARSPVTSFELREELKRFAEEGLNRRLEDVGDRMRRELREELRQALQDTRPLLPVPLPEISPPTLNHQPSRFGQTGAEHQPHDWSMRHMRGFAAMTEIKEAQEAEAELNPTRKARKSSVRKSNRNTAFHSHGELSSNGSAFEGSQSPKAVGKPSFHSPEIISMPSGKTLCSSTTTPDQPEVLDQVLPFGGPDVGDIVPGAPPENELSQVLPVPPQAPAILTASFSAVSEKPNLKLGTDDDHHRYSFEVAVNDLSTVQMRTEVWTKTRNTSKSVVYGPYFDYVVGILICLNALFIGVQTDYVSQHRGEEMPNIFRIVEVCFCVMFSTELLMRFIVDYWRWLTMTGWQWNIFDSIVVILQLAEEALNIIMNHVGSGEDNQMPNLSFMRVLRILRLVRIIRLVRILRLIGELRTLVTSIMSSMKSLGWTVVLLVLIIYSVGVYLTQLVSDQRRDEELEDYYGSVFESMFSLFQSVTGGIDWNDAVVPLRERVSPLLAIVFSLYIAFTVLAVMNVVTGVFVESALLSAQKDQDIYMVNNMRDLFIQANGGSQGSMTWTEFESRLASVQMQDYFKSIDVDPCEAHGIFRLLDLDNSGSVEMEEFVSGCIRLRGQAKALDLAVLIYEIRRLAAHFEAHAKFIEEGHHFATLRRYFSLPANEAAVTDDPTSRDPDKSSDDNIRLGSSASFETSMSVTSVVGGLGNSSVCSKKQTPKNTTAGSVTSLVASLTCGDGSESGPNNPGTKLDAWD